MTQVRAWIGLGSNLDGPADRLRSAIDALSSLPETVPGPASALYRSAAWGVTDQPDFCNAVAALDTTLTPAALLAELQAIERDAGRRRTRRWGPRCLDLDILLYGDRVIDDPDLVVPHPHLHERAFVLRPLATLAPGLRVPGRGTVSDLLSAVSDQLVAPWESETS